MTDMKTTTMIRPLCSISILRCDAEIGCLKKWSEPKVQTRGGIYVNLIRYHWRLKYNEVLRIPHGGNSMYCRVKIEVGSKIVAVFSA